MVKKTSATNEKTLVIRFYRLLDVFSQADDIRDFYFELTEGYLIYLDLDKHQGEYDDVTNEIKSAPERFVPIPKLSYYEAKKIMEAFIQEKVYDIDTKEKLLETIHSRGARENFIEFLYDHISEFEKWQQFYLDRSRIRIIEWLRSHNVSFVFEEELEVSRSAIEKYKVADPSKRTTKEQQNLLKTLESKSKSYYTKEAINPRPKRGRPPKVTQKVEKEPDFSSDYYQNISTILRHFLYVPEYTGEPITFSQRTPQSSQYLEARRQRKSELSSKRLEQFSKRLESLQVLSDRLSNIGVSDLEKKKVSTGHTKGAKLSQLAGAILPEAEKEEGLGIQKFFKSKEEKKRREKLSKLDIEVHKKKKPE